MENPISENISGSGLKVLHIASFSGNIGDNANHDGMRRILRQELGKDIIYTELEIRKAYQNYPYQDKLIFNNRFVELANRHDLIIIGGGTLFSIEIEQSQTGTTIDMGIDLLNKITIPIIFHGMGCDHDPFNGAPKHLVKRFGSFIDAAIEKENCLVSVRNDGSSDILKKYFGSRYNNSVYTIPDGGFFAKPISYYHPELPIPDKGKVIGINLAKDMMNYRFQFGSINYDQFIQGLKKVITNKLHEDTDLSVVLIPHIYSDLETVSDLFRNMEDPLRRNRITVSPYVQREKGMKYILDLYANCNLVLGMRFHANVCPIGLKIPTIGLVSYPQISGLYKELGLTYRIVHIQDNGFEDNLHDLIDNSLKNEHVCRNQYTTIVNNLEKELRSFHATIKCLI